MFEKVLVKLRAFLFDNGLILGLPVGHKSLCFQIVDRDSSKTFI